MNTNEIPSEPHNKSRLFHWCLYNKQNITCLSIYFQKARRVTADILIIQKQVYLRLHVIPLFLFTIFLYWNSVTF